MNRTVTVESETAASEANSGKVADSPAQGSNGQGETSFADLLEQYQYPRPERGEILKGRVLRVEDDVVFVDVGAKRDAIVPHQEVEQLDDDLLDNLSKGDQIPVYVIRTPVGDEDLIVSLERGLEQQDWELAQQKQASDDTLELEATAYNKGGLLVQFNRLQGFVPNSHIPELKYIRNADRRRSFKAKKIGSTLPLKIIEIDRQRERLVLSAKEAQKELRQQQLRELKPGQVVTGRVVNIVDYGAFVDLGYVSGLLHVSKMAWDKVDHPSDVLDDGDEVEVVVESVDIERERISLNRQELLPSPWQTFAQEHEVGELLEGEVTAVLDFGAFVRLPGGIEGLLHVSEMTGSGSPQSILQPGDRVLVRIISIEPDQQRLGLSTSRVTTAEEIEWMALRQNDETEEAAVAEET